MPFVRAVSKRDTTINTDRMKGNKVAIIDIYKNGIFVRKLKSIWTNFPELQLACSFEITTQKMECRSKIDKQLFDFLEQETIEFLKLNDAENRR